MTDRTSPETETDIRALGTHGIYRIISATLSKRRNKLSSDDIWAIANDLYDEAVRVAGVAPTSPETETATLEQLQDLQRSAGIPNLPTQQTYEARMAVSREGPRAYEWEDKPYRIVYDLCREIERLTAQTGPVAAEQEEGDE